MLYIKSYFQTYLVINLMVKFVTNFSSSQLFIFFFFFFFFVVVVENMLYNETVEYSGAQLKYFEIFMRTPIYSWRVHIYATLT